MMKPRKILSVLTLTAFIIMLACSSRGYAWSVPDTGDLNEQACNPHSYTDLGNGIIRDNITGLEWQKMIAPGTYTWQEALDYCNALELGGHSDWRLPTAMELATLVDCSIPYPETTIDMTYFPDTVAQYFWSSNAFAGSFLYAWFVQFDSGHVYFLEKTNKYYVRAVRGEVLTSNFIDNGDGTITDTATNLMWEKSAGGAATTWDQAKGYCENLTLGGKSDWRLPTRNELQTIVDYNRLDPAVDTKYFPDIPKSTESHYWTSTTYAKTPGNPWDVFLFNGIINAHYAKTIVRAVRGGRCGGIQPSSTTTMSGGGVSTTVPETTTTTVGTVVRCPATKVLGDGNPDLEALRAFRDSTLARSAVGRRITEIYYTNAESLNAALEHSPTLQAAARKALEAIATMVSR
jgi:hypothetical protein